MSSRAPARLRSIALAASVVVVAALVTVLVHPSLASSASRPAVPSSTPLDPDAAHDRAGPPGADGSVGADVTVFDDVPAVARLDADLRGALRRAATRAADEGIELYVNSGWRSPAYQDRLLRDAIATYGSREEAARWVATADTSPHVSGEAVDVGRTDATVWLSEHGAEYGLCQIYRNEPWHYELRPHADDDGCPAMYADPTHDPRMQR